MSAADDTLAAAFRDALAAVPAPQELRRDQRQWIATDRARAFAGGHLLQAYQSRITALREQAGQARAVRARIGQAGAACLPLQDLPGTLCTVERVRPVPDAPPPGLRMVVQGYRNPADDSLAAQAVAVLAGDGAATRAITWSGGEGYVLDGVGIVRAGEHTLLDVRAHLSGTGDFDAGQLLDQRGSDWADIDTRAWLAQLAARLPKGTAVLKGIAPDWAHMTASTPLWRTGDANCCPKGGRAEAALRLDGDRVALDAVRIIPPP